MKLSEITGNAPAPSGGKMKLSQITAATEPAAGPTMPAAEAPTPTAEKSFAKNSQYADLVKGLPDDIAERVIKENTATGRAAATRSKDAIRKAAQLEKLRLENPYQAEIIENMSGPERLAVGFGEGLTSLARGVGLVGEKDPTVAKMDDALREQSNAAVVGKLAGQTAPFLVPAGAVANIAGTGARVGASTALGAAEGGIIARGEGGTPGEIALSIALGSALGGAGEALVPVAQRVGKAVARRLGISDSAVDVLPDGTPTPEYEAALRRAAEEFPEHELNAIRQKAFDDLGLDYTEAERTRDKSLWVDQQSQARRSGPVNELIERREMELDRMSEEAITGTGGQAERASASVYGAVVGKSDELAAQIDDLYRVARENAPAGKTIKFEGAIGSLKENAPSNEMSGGVVKALRNKMRAMGVMDKKWKASGRISLTQAEELRQYANRLSSSANGEGRYIIRQFKEKLDDDVFRGVDEAAGIDLFRQARTAKREFEQSLDPAKSNRFDQRKTSLVRDVLDNKLPADRLAETVLRRSSKYQAADLQELKGFLSSGTEAQRAAGMQAWDDVRASAMRQIKDKAFTGPITREGTQSLSASRLESAMNSIGPEKMKVLFSPKEREFMDALMKVATYKQAPAGTYSPSGPAIEAAISRIGAAIPWIGPLAGDIKLYVKSKAAERRVLNLVNDADIIRKEVQRTRLKEFRRSPIGATIQAAPLAAIPAVTSSEEN